MAESSKMDRLRNQLAGLTGIGSENDVESRNMVENPTRQESNSVSDDTGEADIRESTEGDFDSTESFKLPSPPAGSPGDAVASDSGLCLCSLVSTDGVDSISSRASLNSYIWSSSKSDLPSWSLLEDEETSIWPSENKFFTVTDPFEENSQYKLITEIGNGAFGKCFLAEEIPVKERFFCVKKCQYRKNELLALELAKKENITEIVEFYGVKIKGGDACIFMEFMAGGTIADLIQEEKENSKGNWLILSEMNSLDYLKDVLKAVKFLHSKGIVHRDIKGGNVLLEGNRLRAKLTDFGSAESCQDAKTSVDIWKIACLLLEMLNGERPPLFINEGSLQRQNSCKPEDYIPPKAIQEIKKLLRFCFGLETTVIPSAVEVLKRSCAIPVAKFLARLKPLGEQVPGSENFS